MLLSEHWPKLAFLALLVLAACAESRRRARQSHHARADDTSGREADTATGVDNGIPDVPVAAPDAVHGRSTPERDEGDPAPGYTAPDVAVGFGHDCIWLAVRSESPHGVAAALGLDELHPIGWSDGVRAAYATRGVFITPVVDGFVLVVSASDPAILESTDVGALSARLGTEVQHFAALEIADWFSWSRAVRGQLLRRVDSLDGGVTEFGEMTPVEVTMDLSGPEAFIHEDEVFEVARAWSIDPYSFDERGTLGLGWLAPLVSAD
ncbi:MAG: hypothetical protein AAGH15_12095 [Myxococcota bacterium]